MPAGSAPTFKVRVRATGRSGSTSASPRGRTGRADLHKEPIGQAKKKGGLPLKAAVLRLPRVLAQHARAPTTGRPTGSLRGRPHRLPPGGAGREVRVACRAHDAGPCASAARAGKYRELARDVLPAAPAGAAVARALRHALRHRRGQLDLLPAARPRRSTAGSDQTPHGLPVRRQGQPLPDPHEAPDRHGAAASGASTSDRAAGRSPKLGPVLWQLPDRFPRDDERLADALASLPPGRHAFEFRHPSWFAEPVYALLRKHGAAFVIPTTTAGRPIPRGPDRRLDLPALPLRPARAPRQLLRARAARVGGPRPRAGAVGEVFAYFNNDWEVFAPRNAARLRKLVGGVGTRERLLKSTTRRGVEQPGSSSGS